MPIKCTTEERLPDILTAQHISDYLGICRRRVYELFQLSPEEGGIPSFDIGLSRRVEKQDFLGWIRSQKESKVSRLSNHSLPVAAEQERQSMTKIKPLRIAR